MTPKSTSLIRSTKTFIIILALTFTSNIHASTALTWGWWRNWVRSWNTHTHYRGCGHDGYTGGSYHNHFRGCGHDGGNQGGGDSIPIDGGLGFLLVGAAAFGVKKLRENKNEKN